MQPHAWKSTASLTFGLMTPTPSNFFWSNENNLVKQL